MTVCYQGNARGGKDKPALRRLDQCSRFQRNTVRTTLIDDQRLEKMLEVISKHRLGLEDAEPDILGRAFENLLRKFA